MQKNNQSDEWQIDNLPNRLTLFRMGLIPVIVFSLGIQLFNIEALEGHIKTLGYIAAWTFTLASVTDFIDGYLARKRNLVTVFGSFLDPIADKFLVVTSLLMLMALGRLSVFIVLILVLREFYMTSLRLLALDKGIKVPVDNLGKAKTVVQMMAIPFIMTNDEPWGIPYPLIGKCLILLACVFSLYSATRYTLRLIRKIQELRKIKKQGLGHEK